MIKRRDWKMRAAAGVVAFSVVFSGTLSASATADIKEVLVEEAGEGSSVDVVSPVDGDDIMEDIEVVEEPSGNAAVVGNDIEITIDDVVSVDVVVQEPVTETESESESESETETEIETETEDDIYSEELEQELNAYITRLAEERSKSSPISEYLKLEELREAIKEKGLTFNLEAGLSDEVAEQFGIPEMMRESSYYKLQTQIDPENRQWLFDTGVVLMGADFVSLGLYGSSEMLALSIPQLYEKAFGIRSGNLYEQIKGTWAEEEFSFIPEENLKNININFYPDEEALIEWRAELEEYYDFEESEQVYEDVYETFRKKIKIRKAENDDEIVYSAGADWEAIRVFYHDWIDACTKPVRSAGLVTEQDYELLQEQLADAFYESEKVMPEGIELEFHIVNDRLNSVTWQIFVDASLPQEDTIPSDLEVSQEDTVPSDPEVDGIIVEESPDGITVVNGSEITTLDTGYINAEIIFWEETEGIMNTDLNWYVTDADLNTQLAVSFSKIHVEEGTRTDDNLSVMFMETADSGELEVTYYCNLFSGMFDSETGEYEMTFSLTDQETESTVHAEVSSKFIDVVPGEGFTWVLDGITIGQDEESLNVLKGKVTVLARPTDIAPPETAMIFEMSEEELQKITEVMARNLESWMGVSEEQDSSEEPEITDGTGAVVG